MQGKIYLRGAEFTNPAWKSIVFNGSVFAVRVESMLPVQCGTWSKSTKNHLAVVHVPKERCPKDFVIEEIGRAAETSRGFCRVDSIV